jgi:type II secretory pathway predicted ATPase ExeA
MLTGAVKGYEVFFGFREPPFSLAPNTRYLFDSQSHAAARTQIAYALERREPLVVVTGDLGTGKTLLCRSVIERLERRTFLSIIHDPQLERDELLKQMLQNFGLMSKDRTRQSPTTRHDLVHALQEFLQSLVPLQAHAVLVIDEAQHIHADVMEQIRLISNIHDASGTMLQIILVGQPSLETLLSRPDLRQLKQRVSRHIRLEPLTAAEMAQYIDHRLAVARDGSLIPHGAALFAPDALSAIWRFSGGVPRIVNLLCDRGLEAAYEQQAQTVTGLLIEAAARELDLRGVPDVRTDVRAVPEPRPSPEGRTRAEVHELAVGGSRSGLDVWTPEPVSAADDRDAPPPVPDLPDEVRVAFGEPPLKDNTARARTPLVLAAAVVVVAALAWFGVRALNRPAASESTFTGAAPPPAERRPPAPAPDAGPPPAQTPPVSAPPSSATTAPAPVTPAPGPAATPVSPLTSAVPAAAVTSAVPASFEIVIASFRTVTRATQVAAELTAIGQKVRQRESDGWQQVLAGPFVSRAAAEEAQQKLDAAGYTGTKIVPAAR